MYVCSDVIAPLIAFLYFCLFFSILISKERNICFPAERWEENAIWSNCKMSGLGILRGDKTKRKGMEGGYKITDDKYFHRFH